MQASGCRQPPARGFQSSLETPVSNHVGSSYPATALIITKSISSTHLAFIKN